FVWLKLALVTMLLMARGMPPLFLNVTCNLLLVLRSSTVPKSRVVGDRDTWKGNPTTTETVLLPLLAAATSSRPSSLKSPTTVENGNVPVGGEAPCVKLRGRSRRKMEPVLSLSLATARSGSPPPLKSPTATDMG